MAKWVIEIENPSLNVLHGELLAIISKALNDNTITRKNITVSYKEDKGNG